MDVPFGLGWDNQMDLQEMLRLATELGRETGSVTFDQLGELGIDELPAEEVETLFAALRDEGIELTD
jgi:hypothetical protein